MNASLDRLTSAAGQAWIWWLGELKQCLPVRARALLLPEPMLVRAGGGRLVVAEEAGSALELPWPLTPEGRKALAGRIGGRDVRVLVAEGEALVCPVRLPLTAERALSQALSFEIERRTPFFAADLASGHRVRARDAAANMLDADLVAVPRRVLDPLLAAVSAAGATLAGLAVQTPDGPVPIQAPGSGARPRRLSRFRFLAWAGAVAAILVGTALPVIRAEQERARVHDRIAELRPRADAVAETERQVDALAAQARRLDGFRAGITAQMALAALTEIADDSTHLTSFSMSDGTIRIEGHTGSATALVAALDASPLFGEPVFQSPVVPGAQGRERFSLALDIDMSAAEEPR